MTIILMVVAVSGLPAYTSVLINAVRVGSVASIEWMYMAVYVSTVALACLYRLDFRLRGWGIMALSYSNAAASFMRLGLVGSGRLWLIVMPVIATLVLGSRAGYAMAALSLAVYAAFSMLATTGYLGGWMVLHRNPQTLDYWIEGGAALVVFLAAIVVLVERFVSLQRKTLADSRLANTKLEETSRELRESESRLRAIGDNLPGGMIFQIVASPDGSRKFTYVSAGVYGLHGYTPDQVLADASLLYRRIAEEDVEQYRNEEEKSLREMRPFDVEARFPGSLREIRWSRVIAQLEKTKEGGILVNGVELDITRRKTAELELQRKNEELTATNEELNAAMEELEATNEALVESSNELVQANQRLAESEARYRMLSNYYKLLNSNFITLAEARTVEDLFGMIADQYRRFTGARGVLLSQYDHEDSSLKVVAVSASAEDVAGAETILGVKLTSLRIPVGNELREMMIREVIKRSSSLSAITTGAIPQPISDRIMEAIAGREVIALAIYHGSDLVGTALAFMNDENTYLPVDTLGTFAQMAGLAVKRKKTEEEIIRLNLELERKVEQRTRELKKAYDDLMSSNRDLETALRNLNDAQSQLIQSEKLAALGQLAAGIAHELNTPLGAIISSNRSILVIMNSGIPGLADFLASLGKKEKAAFMTLLSESLETASRIDTPAGRKKKKEIASILREGNIPGGDKLISLIVDSGVYGLKEKLIEPLKVKRREEMLKSIRTLFSIKRLGEIIAVASGKASHAVGALQNYMKQDVDEEFTQVNVHDEIETILTLYHNKIKYGVSVHRNFQTVEPVLGNRDKLNQVWINLLNNALQAIDYEGTIEIEIEKMGSWIVVSFADSGPGIPDSIRGRIFDPFFTTKKHGEGMGLGLDISRKIIDKHGGRIIFETAPGKTKFSVWLKKAAE